MKNSGFDFEIDVSVNCIFIKHFGLFELDTILKRGEACANDPLYGKNLNRLVDVTGCDEMLSAEDLRSISVLVESQSSDRGSYKEALFVDTMLSHGVARMFDSLKRNMSVEYQIFHNDTQNVQAELKAWLGIPEDYKFPNIMSIR